MAKQVNTSNFLAKPKVKRPNVHAKTKASKLKSSKTSEKLDRLQSK